MISSRSLKNTVKLNRLISLALCFGVAFLLLAGSAFAGTTTVGTTHKVALQVGKVGTAAYYTLTNTALARAVTVARGSGQNFYVKVDLGTGYLFGNGLGGGLPANGDITATAAALNLAVYSIGSGPGPIVSMAKWAGGTATDQTVSYLIGLTGAFQSGPTFTIDTTTWAVKDSNGALGAAISLYPTITTTDSGDGFVFDTGTETATNKPWIQSINGVTAAIASPTNMTIDTTASAGRKKFITSAASADGLTITTTTLQIDSTTLAALGRNGLAYAFTASDVFTVSIGASGGGSTTGIARFVWAPLSGNVLTGTPTTAITLPGTNGGLGTTPQFLNITVDGATPLLAGTINLTVTAVYANATTGTLINAGTLSTWVYSGTVLVSPYAQGNSTAFKTRFYIYNPGAGGVPVSVAVYESPWPGSVTRTAGGITTGNELANRTLGSSMGSATGMTIRLWEDVLTPAGVTPTQALGPDGNGNLVVIITVQAPNCKGYTQVISADSLTSYGMTAMLVQ